MVKGLFANPSQMVDRMAVGYRPATPSTKLMLYSYEHDRCVSPGGMMRCLGFPSNLTALDMFSNTEYRLLSGNAYSAPLAALITAVMYCSEDAPWWKFSSATP